MQKLTLTQLLIDLFSGETTKTVTLKVQPKSYYDNFVDGPDPVPNPKPGKLTKGRAGVSGGAVAGISICLVLVAIVLTIIVVNFILKRRGVALFQHARFNNEANA